MYYPYLSHVVFRYLRCLGFLDAWPSHRPSSRWKTFMSITLGVCVMACAWGTILCEILLNVWKAEVKETTAASSKAEDTTGFTSNLVNTIFDLRVLFRRFGTTMMLTIGFAKRKAITTAVFVLFTSALKNRCPYFCEVFHARISLGSLASLLYAFLTFTTNWTERWKYNFTFVAGTTPAVPLIGPIATHQWALASGGAMTLTEFTVGLESGLCVTVLYLLAMHLQNLSNTSSALLMQLEVHRGWVGSRMVRELLQGLYQEYEEVAMLIRKVEAGFSALITANLVAIAINYFTIIPMYFEMSASSIFYDYWLNQTTFIVLPSFLFAFLLTASAINMRRSAEISLSLLNAISLLELAELNNSKTLEADTSDRNLHFHLNLEALLHNLENRPLSIELGIVQFVDTKTFATVIVLIMGYLCFLIEHGDDGGDELLQLSSGILTHFNITLPEKHNTSSSFRLNASTNHRYVGVHNGSLTNMYNHSNTSTYSES